VTVKEDRKRARERAHFEAFRAAYSDFPLGIVESAQQPDFTVVTEAGERLGIEHTEYLVMDAEAGDSYLKMRESLQEKVTSRARQAYEARRSPAVLAVASGNRALESRLPRRSARRGGGCLRFRGGQHHARVNRSRGFADSR